MSRFLEAIKNARATKTLDKVLQGSGNSYLGEGPHDVSIIAVDSSKFAEDTVDVTYANAEGKQQRDRLFLSGRDGDIGYKVKNLLAATIPDAAALDAFWKQIEGGNTEAFNMLTGLKLRITLGYDKGYKINMVNDPIEGKKFQAVDAESGTPQTELFPTVDEARTAAEAKGLERAYTRVKKSEANNGEANVAVFLSTIAGQQKAQAGSSGAVTGNSVAGTKTPSFV